MFFFIFTELLQACFFGIMQNALLC